MAKNRNKFNLIFCPHNNDNEKIRFYNEMSDEGYHNNLEFVLVGKDNASRMFKPDMTEEKYLQGRDNNLLRHLVRIEIDKQSGHLERLEISWNIVQR